MEGLHVLSAAPLVQHFIIFLNGMDAFCVNHMRGYKDRTGTQTLWSLPQQTKLNIQLFPVYTCQREANEEEKS